MIHRDLADAAVAGLSQDRRFATAYNAVPQVSKMVIACSGYRVLGQAHHQTTFVALDIAMGPAVSQIAIYFDVCRRKRNLIEYFAAHKSTKSESDDLVEQAEKFLAMGEEWIELNFPQFKADSP